MTQKKRNSAAAISVKMRKMFPGAYDVLANIDAQQTRTGISDSDLCEAMRKSADTLCRRRKAPWDFTLRELDGISEALGISLWELVIPRAVIDKIIADHAFEVSEIAQALLQATDKTV